MKILMINVVCGIRSTGRICTDLAAALEKLGHEVKIAYGRETVPEKFQKYAVRIGNDRDVKLHGLKARAADGCGFGSRKATEKFIAWVKAYDPDVIHLHNLHGYYIHIGVLFDYLKKSGKKVFWTLHDCWAFTGHAAYCEAAGCERWITGCHSCPKLRDYPASVLDRSAGNWAKKKKILSGLPDMTIITPSYWLAGLVSKSFLGQYSVEVIHNGVDLSVFRPGAGDDAGKRLGAGDRKIALGVAALWEERKGLNDLIRLSGMLNDQWCIVIVGVSDELKKELPESIIAVGRVSSPAELAKLYSAADVYVNPTYEDNYPTTNIEAIACGTPVLTYQTGGSGESAELFGRTVEKGNIEALKESIETGDYPAVLSDLKELGIEHFCEQYIKLFQRAER